MKLNLITFASSLASRESIFTDHKELLDCLKNEYEVNYIFPEELGKGIPDGPSLVFVGSGGVEESVSGHIDLLPSYTVLVADGLKNSLAASLEILSWMRQEGRQGCVLHGTNEYIMRGINEYVSGYNAIENLKGKRVGIIGRPSGWLISSGAKYESVRAKWGVEMIDLPLQEVIDRYNATSDASVESLVETFISQASDIKEPTRTDITKAMRLYTSLKEMCEHHGLDAFTLNCFDLIPKTKTTGCLALAKLNDDGIPAGCEGDMQTLLTMLAVKAATGMKSFMANPSRITNNDKHEMVFAHCTIALSMTDHYIIRNHYESLSGVAIEGILPKGEVTVVKCGGKEMTNYFISKAELLECTSNPIMCRTQMRLRLDKPLEYFLNRSIGNHHVIIPGNWEEILASVFTMLDARDIEA